MKRSTRNCISLAATASLLAACASPMPAPTPEALVAALPAAEPAIAYHNDDEVPAPREDEILEARDPDAPLIVNRRYRPPDRRAKTLVENAMLLAGFPGPGTFIWRALGKGEEANFLLGEPGLTPWDRYRLEVNPYLGRERPWREMKLAFQALEMRGLRPCDEGGDFLRPPRDRWGR